MPRKYRHISKYEKEIMEMKSQGKTLRAIGEKYGFTYEQVHNFISRHNKNQRMLEAGKALHQKGRPCKKQKGFLPPSIQRLDKLAQMRYVMASKDRYIKQLEMELELTRDFLSLIERK